MLKGISNRGDLTQNIQNASSFDQLLEMIEKLEIKKEKQISLN
jgi:hypothetical protein